MEGGEEGGRPLGSRGPWCGDSPRMGSAGFLLEVALEAQGPARALRAGPCGEGRAEVVLLTRPSRGLGTRCKNTWVCVEGFSRHRVLCTLGQGHQLSPSRAGAKGLVSWYLEGPFELRW